MKSSNTLNRRSNTMMGAFAPLLVVLSCSRAAHAADDAPVTVQQSAPVPDDGAIQEVTVTARHVSENLQTTGVAITAFSGQDLEDLHITTATDLMEFTPDLTLKATAGSAADGLTIKIRGIGVSDVDFLNADPSVGMYVDGVFQARAFGPQFYLFDVSDVEVLRGPQGTLYGKNAMGGAINIVTRKPDEDEGAKLEVTAGNYGELDFSAHAATSLVPDQLFASIAAMSRSNDGYYHNTYLTGQDPGSGNVHGARVAFRWIPTDAVKIDLEGDYAQQQALAPPFVLLALSPTGLGATGVAAAGLNPNAYVVGPNPSWSAIKNVENDNGANGGSFLPQGYGGRGRDTDDATFKGMSLTGSVDITPIFSVRSISSYRTFNRFVSQDVDGTPASVIDSLNINNGSDFTQELQLHAQLFDRHLDLTVGGFFLHEQLHEDQSNGFLTGLAEDVTSLQSLSTRNVHEFTNNSEAAFTHAIWSITDETRITGGVRYSKETKTADYKVGPLNTLNDFSTLNERLTLPFSSVTPMIEAEHDVTKDAFVYASASKGYASGGFNETPSALTGRIATFEPETMWSYEVGFKSEFFDHRLRFNVAGFLMNYDNIVIQSFGVSPTNGGIGLETTNAGKARVTGAEEELQWRITRQLMLRAALSQLDQKFLSYGIGANGLAVPPSTAHFFDSPGQTESLNLDYTLPVPTTAGKFTVSGNWSHWSRTWFDNDATPISSQDPYSLLGARVAYTTPNGKLTLTAYGDNLTNEVYKTRVLNALTTPFGLGVAIFGQPLTFGLRVGYTP